MWLSLALMILSCFAIWRSSHGFEVASDYLGRNLPSGIKGATLNAIASSMPEFLTTLFFLFYLRDVEGFSGGLGVSSGSALFNLLIIPAVAILILFSLRKGNLIRIKKKVLMREGAVLLVSQVIFIYFLFGKDLRAWHGLVLVSVYLIYLGILYVIARRSRSTHSGASVVRKSNHRSFITILLFLDVTEIVLRDRNVTRSRAWLLLSLSTLVMTFGTWLLVYATDKFGSETGIHLIFVAVVLSAAATSLPDTIISIKDARKGNYDDALSNALGSNIFDIAFALGLPLLLYNLIYHEAISLNGDVLAFTREVWVFLLLATLLALTIMLIGKKFTRIKAFLLLFVYVLFLLYVGTQVQEGSQGLGGSIGKFLEDATHWIEVKIF